MRNKTFTGEYHLFQGFTSTLSTNHILFFFNQSSRNNFIKISLFSQWGFNTISFVIYHQMKQNFDYPFSYKELNKKEHTTRFYFCTHTCYSVSVQTKNLNIVSYRNLLLALQIFTLFDYSCDSIVFFLYYNHFLRIFLFQMKINHSKYSWTFYRRFQPALNDNDV